MQPPKDLRPLLSPKTIAVIGASEKFGAGSLVIENLHALGFEGRVVPVNPRYSTVLGLDCYPSLDKIPGEIAIDCAAVVLGAGRIMPMMKQAAQRGVRGAWAFASGFAEIGEEGARLQEELSRFCHENGIMFCGPNCVGYVNLHDKTGAFSAPVSPTLKKGCVGVVAQSGSVVLALANSNRGVGFSTIVSSGNEAVLDTVDYMEHFLKDENTNVIAAFIEGVRRPEAFKRACIRAAKIGKPVIAVKVGRSELARKTAVSHTGALAGSDQVHDAFFEKFGVIRVEDLDQLLETAALFSQCYKRLPKGNRVGMITVSGGEIGLVGDASREFSFVFPPLSPGAQNRLKEKLPDYASIANPLDAWGSGDLVNSYPACMNILAGEEAIDIVAVSQDSPPGMSDKQVRQYTDVAKAAAGCAAAVPDKPVVVFSHVSGGLDPTLKKILDDGGVAFLQGTRESLAAIDHLTAYAQFLRNRKWIARDANRSSGRLYALIADLKNRTGVLGHEESKALLAAYGVNIAKDAITKTAGEATAAAEAIGYPVVMKGVSPQAPHKTEAGLVRLNVNDETEVRETFRHFQENLRAFDETATLEGVLIQRMISPDAVEIIVGISTDPVFGPVVVIGLGGVFVELLKDTKLMLPPVDREEARAMITALKGRRVLEGFRGKPRADVDALIDVIVSIGRIALDFKGAISSVDINPLMVLPEGQGVVAADVLVELTG